MADANMISFFGKFMSRSHSLNKYRNIGIMAHIDAGNHNWENIILHW